MVDINKLFRTHITLSVGAYIHCTYTHEQHDHLGEEKMVVSTSILNENDNLILTRKQSQIQKDHKNRP
jgi:hypothetical protein